MWQSSAKAHVPPAEVQDGWNPDFPKHTKPGMVLFRAKETRLQTVFLTHDPAV